MGESLARSISCCPTFTGMLLALPPTNISTTQITRYCSELSPCASVPEVLFERLTVLSPWP